MDPNQKYWIFYLDDWLYQILFLMILSKKSKKNYLSGKITSRLNKPAKSLKLPTKNNSKIFSLTSIMKIRPTTRKENKKWLKLNESKEIKPWGAKTFNKPSVTTHKVFHLILKCINPILTELLLTSKLNVFLSLWRIPKVHIRLLKSTWHR